MHLLLSHLIGLRAEGADRITITPALPQSLRRAGTTYRVGPVPWGKYILNIECSVKDAKSYRMQVHYSQAATEDVEEQVKDAKQYVWDWDGQWGEERTFVFH